MDDAPVRGRLRVCLLVGRYPPDFTGHGIQIERLLPHLRDGDVDAEVVTRRSERWVSWPSADTAPVHRILPARGERLARLRGAAGLAAWLLRHRRDFHVVHGAFADWDFYLNVPLLRLLGLPVLHEMVLIGADDPEAVRRERLGELKLRLLRGVDAWVGISEAFVPTLAAAGIDRRRFHCIPTALDVERYRPADPKRRRELRARFDVPEDARVVVSVGALLPRKGMDRLLRGWARLGPRPGRDLLLLVGPATEAEGLRPQFLPHVRELEALADSPGVAGTVRFVGRVDDVHEYMAVADVFAFLSHQEGFGTVIAEALASELPCVVSPLDGIWSETLGEGDAGYVLEDPDDAEAVAARLSELLASPERRRRMGAEGRRRACKRFSMSLRAERLGRLYRELAARRRGDGWQS